MLQCRQFRRQFENRGRAGLKNICSLFVQVQASSMPTVISFTPNRDRRSVIIGLKHLLRPTDTVAKPGVLTFDLPAIDDYLPQGGLSLGALHDIVSETAELPAAFGFAIALISRLARSGPVLIVISPTTLLSGRIYGHGLNTIGLEPERVLLAEAGDQIQAYWVIEEALKSKAPAAIAAIAGADPDLKTSRRLHLAAGKAGLPLLLLKPGAKGKASAAMTRWRIGAAQAARDRFGLLKAWRWRLVLERCRNGRPGEWSVEFDHDTHRFSLAHAMADRTFPQSAVVQSLARRSG
jgi:protein ImuA